MLIFVRRAADPSLAALFLSSRISAVVVYRLLVPTMPETTSTKQLPAMSLAALLLLSSSASAGPPFITDDPEPTDYQHWEVYIFSQGVHATGEISGVVPPSCDCNYGGLPNVQLHFQPGMAISRPEGKAMQWGVGDTEFGIKYRFLEQDKASWVPSVAIYPLLEAPTGNAARGLGTGRTHAFVPLWIQKDLGDWTTFGGGGYWINPGPGNKNHWFVGWVLERKITDKFTLGVELFHETPDKIGGLQTTGFNVGGIYDFTDHYHFLFAFGKGLQHAKETNQFSWYVGFEWTGGE
jgi:hypothetical protein